MINYDINKIYEEIQICLNEKCFFAALMLALSLPDVCKKVALKINSKETSYISWFNKRYDKRYFPDLVRLNDRNSSWGKIVYDLRCSIMHDNNIDLCEKDNRVYKLDDFEFFVENTNDVFQAISVKSNEYATIDKRPILTIKINLVHFIHGIMNAVRNFVISTKLDKTLFPNLLIGEIENEK